MTRQEFAATVAALMFEPQAIKVSSKQTLIVMLGMAEVLAIKINEELDLRDKEKKDV